MDRSLQLMRGLALIENPLQFTAKPWIAEQVTQIYPAQARTRKFPGSMMRKLSVTSSQ
jgi:hypothetical protein